MSKTIELDVFKLDTVLTITFINMTDESYHAWVCKTAKSYIECLEELKSSNHIRIVHHGASIVKGIDNE